MKKLLLLFTVFSCSMVTAQASFSTQNIATIGTQRGVIDMNGDNLDDIVSVTQTNVNIFYQLATGGFEEVNITTSSANFTPSWSMAAADYDANGYTDLLYGGGSGVTFMKANSDGTAFEEISGPEFVFSQRSNFVDIDNDGNLDAFVCHDVEPNVYYLNDGAGNLSFNQGGLGDYPTGGNYGSVWIDYNNDGLIDMFIAKCGGEPERRENQLFQGMGDGVYVEVSDDAGLADAMQTWSSAWGDYDNDGDMDIWIGASTFADGFHRLMENNGDGTFTDRITGSGLESFNGTGIENSAFDFDNDGNLDIASNGDILFGNGDLTFTVVENAFASDNGAFGDLNNDGFIDAMSGDFAYINDASSGNNWTAINLKGTDSNIHGIGARIEVLTASGMQIRDVRSGEGFRFMSTMRAHFGIGADEEITSITIKWPSGTVDVLENPAINTALVVEEGETNLSTTDASLNSTVMFPNPVDDQLNIKLFDGGLNARYSIIDVSGKILFQGALVNSPIDVASLTAGTYFLKIETNTSTATKKFIKK